MRAVALVTLTFLPATFVSVCTPNYFYEQRFSLVTGTVQHDLLQLHTRQRVSTGGLGRLKRFLGLLVSHDPSNDTYYGELVLVAVLAAPRYNDEQVRASA